MCRASGFLAFCGVMLQTQAVLHSLSAHIEAEDLRLLSETNLAPSPCGGKRSTALACSDVLTEKPRATRPVKGLELRSVGCNPHAQPLFRAKSGARQDHRGGAVKTLALFFYANRLEQIYISFDAAHFSSVTETLSQKYGGGAATTEIVPKQAGRRHVSGELPDRLLPQGVRAP